MAGRRGLLSSEDEEQWGESLLVTDPAAAPTGVAAPAQGQPALGQPGAAAMTPQQRWAQMMAPFLPPEREVFAPTPQQQADMKWSRQITKAANMARAMSGATEFADARAAGDALRAQQQALLDEKYAEGAARAKALREATPADRIAFMGWKADGNDGDYADFLRISMRSSGPTDFQIKAEMRRQARAKETGDPNYQLTVDELRDVQRSSGSWAGMPLLPGEGGELAPYGGAGALAEVLAALARAQKSAGEQGTQESKTAEDTYRSVNAALSQLDSYQSIVDVGDQFAAALESGEISTGIENRLFALLGVTPEAAAAMDVEQIKNALANLQITNLAPVTVFELQMMMNMWGNIYEEEKPSAARIRQAQAQTRRAMDLLKGDIQDGILDLSPERRETLQRKRRYQQYFGEDDEWE